MLPCHRRSQGGPRGPMPPRPGRKVFFTAIHTINNMCLMISVADRELLTKRASRCCTGAVRFGIVSHLCVLACVLALEIEMTAQAANALAIFPHICLNNRWLWSTESRPNLQRPSRRAVILPTRSLSFPYRCRPPVALAISSSRGFRPLRSNRFPFPHSTTSFSHSLRPFRASHPLHRIPFLYHSSIPHSTNMSTKLYDIL